MSETFWNKPSKLLPPIGRCVLGWYAQGYGTCHYAVLSLQELVVLERINSGKGHCWIAEPENITIDVPDLWCELPQSPQIAQKGIHE
jgi:hypothetical protein